MLEWKNNKMVAIPTGQRYLFTRFGRPPDAVICMRGSWEDLQWLIFDGGPPLGWRDTNLEEVKSWIRHWVGQPDASET